MVDVYSYIRWSSDRQEDGSSEARQTEAIQRFCKYYGYTIKEEIADPGVSSLRGRNYHQGKLGEFVKRARDGGVQQGSILLFENQDRMSRMRIGAATNLFMDILKTGVSIGIADTLKIYSFDNLQLGDFIQVLVEIERANKESERKRDFGVRGWKKNLEKQSVGKPVTSKCPSWLKVVDDDFVVIDEQLNIIKSLFEETLIQGVAAACKTVNEKFNISMKLYQAQYLLKNRKLIGEHTRRVTDADGKKVDGETIAGAYPPVIDLVLFNDVQEKIAARKFYSGRYEKSHLNFLTGLVKCEHCKGSVRWMNKGNKEYFICTPSMTGQCKTEGTKSLRAEVIRRKFLNLEKFTKVRELLAKSAEQAKKLEVQMAKFKRQLEDNHKRQNDYKQKMLTGDQSLSEVYAEAILELKKEESVIQNTIDGIESQLREALSIAKAEISTDKIEWLVSSTEKDAISARQKLNREMKKLFKEILIDFENEILYFKPREGFYPRFPVAIDDEKLDAITLEEWNREG